MPSLRIAGGALRGRRVPVPAADVRPTSERARQAYFNIVHDRIDGARFLDLFAGSGIFSFEALSRGASAAVAVEQSRKQCTAIEGTAQTLGVAVTTLSGDALEVLPRIGTTTFDLVYADPPYDYNRYGDLLAAIAHAPLADEALVAVEHRRRSKPFHDTPLREIRRTEYGEVWITFFQR
jgi:16S rRNA (guanine966-N2)-methyltransferase